MVSDGSHPLVLFVDDEPRALGGYRVLLRKEAYDILTVTSGLLALEVLAKNHVDVVVTDERMPGMSGSELLERVQRDYPDAVRIMLTGEASLEASVLAIKSGVYRFLCKPVEPDDLRRAVADALNSRRAFSSEAQTRPDVVARSKAVINRARARAAGGGMV